MRSPRPAARLWVSAGRVASVGILGMLLSALSAASFWLFFRLADEVMEGDTHAFDQAVLLALRDAGEPRRSAGPAWLELTARDITSLGGYPVLILMTLAAIGFLLIAGKRHAALLVLVSIGGGMLLSSGLKDLFDRPRPDLVPHAVEVYTHELSQRPRHALRRDLPDPGRAARPGAAAARRQGLPAGVAIAAGAADRREPRLPRRALADRRAGRLVRRRRLGDAVLDGGGVAATTRRGGGGR